MTKQARNEEWWTVEMVKAFAEGLTARKKCRCPKESKWHNDAECPWFGLGK